MESDEHFRIVEAGRNEDLSGLLSSDMFPYRDENETLRTPYVTVAIIAINVLVWLFIQGAGMALPLASSVCNLGLIPGELTETLPPDTPLEMGRGLVCLTDPGRQISHVITSMFLHGSWMHLIGNMWFFWVFGNNIEDSMGRGRFVVFYLVSGLCAAGLQVLLSPMSNIPMVGASGAISGIMGAYLVLYPRVRVFSILPLGFFITTVALPAWVMLGYWMLLQFLGGLQSIGGTGGGTAFGAHVGGFIAGLALIKLFARPDYIQWHKAHHWRPSRAGLGRGSDDF
jgi:membrane associated rhomboid family serine protease